MLAARDQENLVHGHHAAAAAKPLNQGIKHLAPKTPGNKAPKTPFKIPLNDENGGFGGGKTGFKTNGRGNENAVLGGKKGGLGDKHSFVTPMGPRSRAPLGMKTTNAKTKVFQTPAPPPADEKPDQKSASARKAKPRVSHAEMTKLEILGDHDLEERDIEYMPPKPKDMPDLPDDHYEVNLTMFENGGLMEGALGYFAARKDVDGLSHIDREEQRRQKLWDRLDKKQDAEFQRSLDSQPVPCVHEPECRTELCKDTIAMKKAADERYQKIIAELYGEDASSKKPAAAKPSIMKSKSAATALSQSKNAAAATKAVPKPELASAKARLNTSLTSRPKKPAVPTNPSSMRHTAAVANSKTTLGYAKGRSTSATLRKNILPKKESETPDTSLSPAEYIQRYGEPEFGSEMWIKCKTSGCFDEDEGPSLEEIFAGDNPNAMDKLIREQAEEDFQLTF